MTYHCPHCAGTVLPPFVMPSQPKHCKKCGRYVLPGDVISAEEGS